MSSKLGWLGLALSLACGPALALGQDTPAKKPEPPSEASAISPAKRAKIEELLMVMGMKARLEEANETAREELLFYGRRNVMVLGDVPPEHKAELAKLSDEYLRQINAVAPRITWEAISGPLFDICARAFTDAEIDGIISFYKTPAGAALRKHRAALEEAGQLGAVAMRTRLTPETVAATEQLNARAATLRGEPATPKP